MTSPQFPNIRSSYLRQFPITNQHSVHH